MEIQSCDGEHRDTFDFSHSNLKNAQSRKNGRLNMFRVFHVRQCVLFGEHENDIVKAGAIFMFAKRSTEFG